MKKYLFFCLVFFLPFSSNSQEGIFFIDVDFLLNNSNYGNQILLKLKKANDENLKEIENLQKELKKDDDEINRVKNIISQDYPNYKDEYFYLPPDIKIYSSYLNTYEDLWLSITLLDSDENGTVFNIDEVDPYDADFIQYRLKLRELK